MRMAQNVERDEQIEMREQRIEELEERLGIKLEKADSAEVAALQENLEQIQGENGRLKRVKDRAERNLEDVLAIKQEIHSRVEKLEEDLKQSRAWENSVKSDARQSSADVRNLEATVRVLQAKPRQEREKKSEVEDSVYVGALEAPTRRKMKATQGRVGTKARGRKTTYQPIERR
ncbi:uncharacterized protein BCR38DRAFT_524643 [Pseudomassariella vexata]|uniref:Uncharacterized protein n=1 Tax=Pseudomassariella vexata TaxID=1141098 RepID=A0A1Y2DUQ5_9PEZI|nr:uncharacterized protein BCR38DRAFT_524643 [Pseudomassariella vexata]ORY62988.1 hypothetical protein BCR38DRAFT_524643 [Pseudomassariella vexata]